MIKYLLRKTIYNNLNIEAQDMLLQLTTRYYIIHFLCITNGMIILLFSILSQYAFIASIDIGLASSIFELVIYCFMLIGLVETSLFYILFLEPYFIFLNLVAQKVYFVICTTRGKALSRKDFKVIKNTDNDLYDSISSEKCQGKCYFTCFHILKSLEKGCIEFIATKKVSLS